MAPLFTINFVSKEFYSLAPTMQSTQFFHFVLPCIRLQLKCPRKSQMEAESPPPFLTQNQQKNCLDLLLVQDFFVDLMKLDEILFKIWLLLKIKSDPCSNFMAMITGVPECQKSWWGQSGLSPNPGWNRVTKTGILTAKKWQGQVPTDPIRSGGPDDSVLAGLCLLYNNTSVIAVENVVIEFQLECIIIF